MRISVKKNLSTCYVSHSFPDIRILGDVQDGLDITLVRGCVPCDPGTTVPKGSIEITKLVSINLTLIFELGSTR